jgi:hypothetical protein
MNILFILYFYYFVFILLIYDINTVLSELTVNSNVKASVIYKVLYILHIIEIKEIANRTFPTGL